MENHADILRKLLESDAEGMVEWMKDPDINRYFLFDPEAVSLESALRFIKASRKEELKRSAYHFAIAGESPGACGAGKSDAIGEYAGTVSLKKIDWKALTAEYAISLRKKYHSKGMGYLATKQILKFAFEELKLNRVYLNVVSDNDAAIKMYERAGFSYEGLFKNHIWIQGEIKSWKWYAILKEDYFKNRLSEHT